MATVSKTFKENMVSNHATWTLTATGTDVIATGSTVSVPVPTMTAKYVYSGKNYAWGFLHDAIFVVDSPTAVSQFGNARRVDYNANEQSWASGAQKNMTRSKETWSYSTSVLFDGNNKTDRSVDVYLNSNSSDYYGNVNLSSWKGTQADLWDGYDGYCGLWGPLETVTLDAPPIVSGVTGSYATPQYAGLGAYTATVESASAQYGGDITSITLTIGSDTTTQSYSSATVSSQTFTITPSVAGTYTPTLTVTDSRGQTTTVPLADITVNAYIVPSVNFDIYRATSTGIKNDEGHYALIQANISFTDAIATLTAPSVSIDGIDIGNISGASITWYTTWTAGSGVQNAISNWASLTPVDHAVTVYALLARGSGGGFAEDTSYEITVTANDSQSGHSLPISQTLSTAFYTIDFQAGGKEIAFGAPANDDLEHGAVTYPDGLFKCRMNFIDMKLVGEIKAYAGITVPNGWLLCDGSEVLKANYPLLYGAIGDNWGTASDSDHFVLPDLQGKVPVGYDSADTDFDTVGESGGEKAHALVADELASHTHGSKSLVGKFTGRRQGNNYQSFWAEGICSVGTPSTTATSNAVGTAGKNADQVTINATHEHDSVGLGDAHNNLQPYAVVKYIICAS